jgi:replicative DNA helicase
VKPVADLAAEEALLGAMLYDREAVDHAVDHLQPEHFHNPVHGHVFAAIRTLHRRGEPVDAVTVCDALTRVGMLDKAGGINGVVALQASAPAGSVAPKYTRIILDLAKLRRLRVLAVETRELVDQVPEDVDGTIERVERALDGVREMSNDGDLLWSFEDVSDDLLEEILAKVAGNGGDNGLTLGLDDLDEILDGLAPGTLTQVGARPGMGKSVLACVAARHVAVDLQRPVVFASMEMDRMELGRRLTAGHCRIDHKRLKKGQLNQRDQERYTAFNATIAASPLHLHDNPHASLASIRKAARSVRRRYGDLGLIVVDYIQLLLTSSGGESRRVEVDELSRGLKVLARELEVPVLSMCQLNRGVDSRADKRPMLSDLRESGGLEQDADVVIFLYRDEVYHPDSQDQGVIELIVAKHRSGPTGTARAAWLGQFQTIANMHRA